MVAYCCQRTCIRNGKYLTLLRSLVTLRKLVLGMVFALGLQSQSNAEMVTDFFDHLRTIEKSEFTARVSVLNFVGDPAVQDINLSLNTVPIEVVAAAGKNDIMALFKLECMELDCSIKTRFDLSFSIEGLSYRIVPKLVLVSYSVDPFGVEDTTLAKEFEKIFNKKIRIEGFASWGDNPDQFWIVDDPSALMKDTVSVDVGHFSKEEKVELIKTCFNRCEKVAAVGKPTLVLDRWLSVKADEVVQLQ